MARPHPGSPCETAGPGPVRCRRVAQKRSADALKGPRRVPGPVPPGSREDGTLDQALEPQLGRDDLVKLYRAMLFSRAADDRQLKLQRQGRMGTFGPSTGQEAVVCGSVLAMTPEDWFVGAFPRAGGRLMRGVKLSEEYLFWNGFEEGSVTPDAPRTLPNAVIVARSSRTRSASRTP